jgi:hypothetical protein
MPKQYFIENKNNIDYNNSNIINTPLMLIILIAVIIFIYNYFWGRY